MYSDHITWCSWCLSFFNGKSMRQVHISKCNLFQIWLLILPSSYFSGSKEILTQLQRLMNKVQQWWQTIRYGSNQRATGSWPPPVLAVALTFLNRLTPMSTHEHVWYQLFKVLHSVGFIWFSHNICAFQPVLDKHLIVLWISYETFTTGQHLCFMMSLDKD